MKKLIRFRTDNKDLINWLASKPNTSEFIESLLEAARTGKLPTQLSETKELDITYKQLRNKNLDLDIQLKEKKLSYMGVFHSEPSSAAVKAMSKGIEQRDFNESEFENVKKFITIRKDSFNQNKWNGKCDLCKEGETYDTYKEMIDDMIRHLTTEHAKKVMEMRN